MPKPRHRLVAAGGAGLLQMPDYMRAVCLAAPGSWSAFLLSVKAGEFARSGQTD